MGWASQYIEKLRNGETVRFRPRGSSMAGKIDSGQLVTVVPLGEADVLVDGDIVLCKVNGMQFLHLVKSRQGFRVLIGNNKGRLNGWTSLDNIYGKVVSVEN